MSVQSSLLRNTLAAGLLTLFLIVSLTTTGGQATSFLQTAATPVFLPLIANGSSSEWLQFAHDPMRTSFTDQVVLTPWRLKWIWNGPDASGKVAIGKFGLPRQSQPITGGGRVYIAAGSRGIFALNNTNGNVVWNATTIGSINSTPAYDPRSDALLVVSANGSLYRLNAAIGNVLVQFNAGSSSDLPLPPALWQDTVFFSMGSKVFALERSTLTKRWEYNAGSPVETPPAFSPSTQTVVVVSQDLYVHAINASDGSRRWRAKPTPLQPGDPAPVGSDGNRIKDTDNAEVRYGWPVIAEQHGLVFIRYRLDIQSLYNFDTENLRTNPQIRQFLRDNRKEQPLFALWLRDGSEAFIPNISNGGFGDGGYMPMGPLPAIARLPDGKEVAYTVMRIGPPDPDNDWWDSYLGELLLDNQTVPGYEAGYVRVIESVNSAHPNDFPSDEQPFLTISGDMILGGHWMTGMAVQILNRNPTLGSSPSNPIGVKPLPHIGTSQEQDLCGRGFSPTHYCEVGLAVEYRLFPTGFYIYWQEGNVYDRYWSEYASWVVSNNTIYFVSTDGAVVALEHGQPTSASPNTTRLAASSPDPTPPPILPQPISYEQAAQFAGWQASVEGQLVHVFQNYKAVYLSFVEPHQRQFIVRILKEDWDAFPQPPENLYRPGQRVRVSGVIGWYQGGPVIYARTPDQIQILAEAQR